MNLDLGSLTASYKENKKEEITSSSYLEKFVRMPEGKGSVTLRILPPAPSGAFGRDKSPFFQWTRIHKVNGKSLHDPRVKVDGRWVGKNPIGDYLKWLWKESETKPQKEKEEMQNSYREMKPIERYYYNVIVRSERDENGNVAQNVGPKILSVGKTVHEIILRGIVGDEEMNIDGYGDVTDFKTGRDFKLMKSIRKSGENTYPSYEASCFVDPSPAGTPEECEEWMKNLHDLSALRVLKTPEELENELAIHLGYKQEDTDGFDPSKFANKNNVDKNDVVFEKVETKVESKVSEVSDSDVDVSDDDDIDVDLEADADFLSELKNIK
jgi:hypothetical protein